MAELELQETDEYGRPFTSRKILGDEQVPMLVNFVLKVGIVKNGHQAYQLLAGVALLCFAFMVIILFSAFSSPTMKTTISKDEEAKIHATMGLK
jgi:hypothetical protein